MDVPVGPGIGPAGAVLLQIDYDLRLDLRNLASERTTYAFTVDVGHQPGAADTRIDSVRGWASFDDGTTWQETLAVPLGGDKRLVIVRHPRVENTSGAVSLRFTARDAAGNSIDQTILRAYGLRPVS